MDWGEPLKSSISRLLHACDFPSKATILCVTLMTNLIRYTVRYKYGATS